MILTTKSGSVIINGEVFKGKNISITRGQVMVDGVNVETDIAEEPSIVITGDVESVETETGNVTCKNVGRVSTMSGDVDVCGDVAGNIDTMSGDVDCCDVGGNVSTMSGDITKHEYE